MTKEEINWGTDINCEDREVGHITNSTVNMSYTKTIIDTKQYYIFRDGKEKFIVSDIGQNIVTLNNVSDAHDLNDEIAAMIRKTVKV